LLACGFLACGFMGCGFMGCGHFRYLAIDARRLAARRFLYDRPMTTMARLSTTTTGTIDRSSQSQFFQSWIKSFIIVIRAVSVTTKIVRT
jgi:hypothetical protein